MATDSRVPRYTFATSYSVRGPRGLRGSTNRPGRKTSRSSIAWKGMKKQDRSNGQARSVAINSMLTRIISEGSNEEAAGQRRNRGQQLLVSCPLLSSLLSLFPSWLPCSRIYLHNYHHDDYDCARLRSQWNPRARRRVATRFPRRRSSLFLSSPHENLLPSGPKKRSLRAVRQLVAGCNVHTYEWHSRVPSYVPWKRARRKETMDKAPGGPGHFKLPPFPARSLSPFHTRSPHLLRFLSTGAPILFIYSIERCFSEN